MDAAIAPPPKPKGALTLTCYRCTKQAQFHGATPEAASIAADRKGWRQRNRKSVCPRCP